MARDELFAAGRRYIIYREKHREFRAEKKRERSRRALSGLVDVVKRNGQRVPFSLDKVRGTLMRAAKGMERDISFSELLVELSRNAHDSITTKELEQAMTLSTIAFIERDPAYDKLSSRLVRQQIYREVFGTSVDDQSFEQLYRDNFIRNINVGIENKIFSSELANFDLSYLSKSLVLESDDLLSLIGSQTLYERYFVRVGSRCIETPQAFWMRVAMGLSVQEQDCDKRAIEFYNTLSNLYFICSTPTLFHSGLSHPQLSSCYLSMIQDDLRHIFKVLGDNAQLSKWSGGIGNDWTSIRAIGAPIKSTLVESQGVIPFLKIANDVTVAINRSGKRRGATCAYLEVWHAEIEDFLDLRRNTGDDRRRTHDMNTANWIPDLFMERVQKDETWTLFSPDEVPDLHDLYGQAFYKRYIFYEREALAGRIKSARTISATRLWRKMLTRLFETGHPWLTFKDPCNIRSPQDHCGIIHNSNLCTEITLNTSPEETAVCNLGSINLARHTTADGIDKNRLRKTIRSAIRMLDNVIDINYYPIPEAKNANMKHRPIGMGVMGLQDSLFIQRIPFDSSNAIEFSDTMMEFVSYCAISSSAELAAERGPYPSYRNSKWDRGIFPVDTLDLLEQERGIPIPVPRKGKMDWRPIRELVKKCGIRNSNILAIAPTATIANIAHCFPCVEPIYKNIYVKSNMSGEFTIVNEYLVNDLKKHGLWNDHIREQIKYYDGNISRIAEIPKEIRELYREVFEISPRHLIDIASRRGKWIDQSQAYTIFIQSTSGKVLSETYMYAWEMGLKTTYYLRSMGASQIEKSTLSTKVYGYTQSRQHNDLSSVSMNEQVIASKEENLAATSKVSDLDVSPPESNDANRKNGRYEESDKNEFNLDPSKACKIHDPECEACQ